MIAPVPVTSPLPPVLPEPRPEEAPRAGAQVTLLPFDAEHWDLRFRLDGEETWESLGLFAPVDFQAMAERAYAHMLALDEAGIPMNFEVMEVAA